MRAPNRTFSFRVTALNENGSPTVTKAQPAIGIWQSTDSLTTPSLSQSAFSTLQTGATQLVADVNLEDDYKLGIADMRGDGRPDFSYEARVLYARHHLSRARQRSQQHADHDHRFRILANHHRYGWNEFRHSSEPAGRSARDLGSCAFGQYSNHLSAGQRYRD